MSRTEDEKKFERMYVERVRLLKEIADERAEFSVPFGQKVMAVMGSMLGNIVGRIASAVINLFGDSNAEKIWNFFAEKGLSEEAIAGIMGNLHVESGYDPKSHQIGGGPGRGLLQWTEHERWQGVLKYARDNDTDEWTIETQLNFFWEVEAQDSYHLQLMRNKYGMSFEEFKKLGDYKKAADVFEGVYERAGQPNMSERYNQAKIALDSFGGKGGGEGSGYGKDRQIVDILKAWKQRPTRFAKNSGRTARDIQSGKFDAASFIHRVYSEANIQIGPLEDINQKELLRYGVKIGFDELRTGDIVFFDMHRTYAHAAIYIGNDRCIGMNPGEGVSLINLNTSPWRERISSEHRRLIR